MFSSEYCAIFKKPYFEEPLRVAASEEKKFVKKKFQLKAASHRISFLKQIL